ncbi:Putative glyoxylase CFP32 [Methylobacterium crusticola]|uniref:Glyoxylase CFP32 n=1 Tax=Methylobacterium crusticola TaxID=1697972 RepID=A0ABQ4QWE8_9HYPH|nr:VOC family protein [Methylobacterium crusticola]GJD49695.1 Putative glyoxylase CFP32 [Methylobacterium crusticola]
MVPTHGRFVWFELITRDAAAAAAFYGDVVGWGVRDASGPGMPYRLLTVGETSVCGIMELAPGGATEAGPSWIGYVGDVDVDAAARRAVGLGGSLHIGPMQVPGVSRFAVIADPQAARLGLFRWLMPRPEEGGLADRLGHVGWSELLAADGRAALAFYRALFGWDEAAGEAAGNDRVLASGGRVIGGVVTKPASVPAPFWLHYFVVPDIARAAERVTAGGGWILEGPLEGPGGAWILHGVDPQGALFALLGRGSARTVGARWAADWPGRPSGGRVLVTRIGPRTPAAPEAPPEGPPEPDG